MRQRVSVTYFSWSERKVNSTLLVEEERKRNKSVRSGLVTVVFRPDLTQKKLLKKILKITNWMYQFLSFGSKLWKIAKHLVWKRHKHCKVKRESLLPLNINYSFNYNLYKVVVLFYWLICVTKYIKYQFLFYDCWNICFVSA